MKQTGRRLLSWLMVISMMLSLLPVSVFAADDETIVPPTQTETETPPETLAVQTFTADPVSGEGGSVTLKTANMFPVDAMYNNRMAFVVEGLPEGSEYRAELTFDDEEDTTNSSLNDGDGVRYYRFYPSDLSEGLHTVTIRLVEGSGSSKVVHYTGRTDLWMVPYARIMPAVADLNTEPDIYHTSAINYNLSIKLPRDDANGLSQETLEQMTGRLVRTGGSPDGVIYAASAAEQQNSVNQTGEYDNRYAQLLPGVPQYALPQAPAWYFYQHLYQSKPLPVGEYDLLLYAEGSDSPDLRIERVVRVTDKPVVSVNSYPNTVQVANVAGAQVAYGVLDIAGAKPSDFDLALYDQNGVCLGVSVRYGAENAYGSRYVYEIPLDAPLTKNTQYELRIISDLDYEMSSGNANLYVSDRPKDLAFRFTNHNYANLAGRIAMPLDKADKWMGYNYRFTLELDGRTLAEAYGSPDKDGFFDIEFQTEDGQPYPLEQESYYDIGISYFDEDAYMPEWRNLGNLSVSNYGGWDYEPPVEEGDDVEQPGGDIVENVYAYYNGEFETGSKGEYVTLYVNGNAVTYLNANGITLTKGAYIIETSGIQLTKATPVASAATDAKVVTAVKNLYFTVGGSDLYLYYAEGVKIYDVTDGGAEATVATYDKVVYVMDGILVTHVWIIGDEFSNVEQPGGDVEQPGGDVEQPGGDVEQPGDDVEQPGDDVDEQPVEYANQPRFDVEGVSVDFALYTNSALCRDLQADMGRFGFALRSVADPTKVYAYLPAAALTESRHDGRSVHFTVTAPVGELVETGYYYIDLYYNEALLCHPMTGEALTQWQHGSAYPRYYGDPRSIGYYVVNSETLQFQRGLYVRGYKAGTVLDVELFSFDNLTLEPDVLTQVTVDASEVWLDLPEKVLWSIDLAKPYRQTVWMGGIAVNTDSNYSYLLSSEQLEARRDCSVQLMQADHGTLELIPTLRSADGSAIRQYSEVYIRAIPDEGYMLAPNSVTVNGQPAGGRGFLVTDDCVVTASFMPIPEKTYAIGLPNNIWNGELKVSVSRAAAGERVYVTPLPNEGYKVGYLQYRLKSSSEWIDLLRDEQGRWYFIMPDGPVELMVGFNRLSTYKVNVLSSTWNKCTYTLITDQGTTSSSSIRATETTPVTLWLTPNANYVLLGVTYQYYDSDLGGQNEVALTPGEDGSYSFIMPSAGVTIRPDLAEKKEHFISGTLQDLQSGLTLSYPDKAYTGDTVTVTVTSIGDRYYLEGLYYQVGDNFYPLVPDEKGECSFVMPDNDVFIEFDVRAKYEVRGSAYGIGGVWPDRECYQPGETVTVRVTPAEGYVLEWVGFQPDNGIYQPITADEKGNYTFVMGESSGELRASFIRRVSDVPGGEVYDYDTLIAALGGEENLFVYRAAGDEAEDGPTTGGPTTGEAAGEITGLSLRYDVNLQSPIRVTGGDLRLDVNAVINSTGGSAFRVEGGRLVLGGEKDIRAEDAPAIEVRGGEALLCGYMDIFAESKAETVPERFAALYISGGKVTIEKGHFRSSGHGIVVDGTGALTIAGGDFSGADGKAALLVGNTTGAVVVRDGFFQTGMGGSGLLVEDAGVRLTLCGGEFFGGGTPAMPCQSIRLPEGKGLRDYMAEGTTAFINGKQADAEALSASSYTGMVRLNRAYAIHQSESMAHVRLQMPAKGVSNMPVDFIVVPEAGYAVKKIWYVRSDNDMVVYVSAGNFVMPACEITFFAETEPVPEQQMLQRSTFSAYDPFWWSSLQPEIEQEIQWIQQYQGWKYMRVVLQDAEGRTAAEYQGEVYGFQMNNPGLTPGQYKLFLIAGTEVAVVPLGWQWITLGDYISYGGGTGRSLTAATTSFTVNAWVRLGVHELPHDLTMTMRPLTGGTALTSSDYTILYYAKDSGATTGGSNEDGFEETSLRFRFSAPDGLTPGSYTLTMTGTGVRLQSENQLTAQVGTGPVFYEESFDAERLLWTAKVDGLAVGAYTMTYQEWSNAAQGFIDYNYTLYVEADGSAWLQLDRWIPQNNSSMYLQHKDDTGAADFEIRIDNSPTQTWYPVELNDVYGWGNWLVWQAGDLRLTGGMDGLSGPGTYRIMQSDGWVEQQTGELDDVGDFSIPVSGLPIDTRLYLEIKQGSANGSSEFVLLSRMGLARENSGSDWVEYRPINMNAQQLESLRIYARTYEGLRELPWSLTPDGMVRADLSVLPGGNYTVLAECEVIDAANGTPFMIGVYLGDSDRIYSSPMPSAPFGVEVLQPVTDNAGVTTAEVRYTGAPTGNVTLYVYRQTGTTRNNEILFGKTPVYTADLGRENCMISSETIGASGNLLFVFAQGGTIVSQQYVAFGRPTTATVTFVDWNGRVLDVQEVEAGGSALPPEAPARENYAFIGWDGSYTEVYADVTLTAQYRRTAYTVTFIDWDGQVLSRQSVQPGMTAEIPEDPTRDGYSFAGWDGWTPTVTRDTVIYAIYKKSAVTVTFHLSGGAGKVESQTVPVGDCLTAPEAPTREGYVFAGWSETPGGARDWNELWQFEKRPVQEDTVLYASWWHTITCEGEYLTSDEMAPAGLRTYAKCYAEQLPAGQQVKYLVMRWNGDSMLIYPGEWGGFWFTMPDGNVTLRAVTTQATASLVVRVDKNGRQEPCTVYLSRGSSFWQQDTRPSTDAEGSDTVRFTGLPAGTYTLMIACGSFWQQTEITLENSDAAVHEVTLPAVYSLSGQLHNLSGSADMVWIHLSGSQDSRWGQLESDGSFRFDALPAGEYTFTVYGENGVLPIAEGQTVRVDESDVTGHALTLKASADVMVTLRTNEAQPAFRAYVSLWTESNNWVSGGTVDGKNNTTLWLSQCITEPGTYTLRLEELMGANYMSIPFVCAEVTLQVTEAMLTSGRISADLTYAYPEKSGLAYWSGAQNIVAVDRTEVYPGEMFTLSIRYKNNGSQPQTITFQPQLPDGITYYNKDEQTDLTRTVKAGEAGSLSVALRMTEAAQGILEIPVQATVDQQSGNFGAALVTVGTLTLTAPEQAEKGELFTVSGEAATGSMVTILDAVNGRVLAVTQTAGRFYSAQIALTETTRLTARVGEIITDPVTVEVIEEAPLTVTEVLYDDGMQAGYNRVLDAFAFWRYVDTQLMGEAFDLQAAFSRGDIKNVVFRFCDQDYPAVWKNGGWSARLTGWGGSGVKPIYAVVTMQDGTERSVLAAYVNLLIDPSGIICDENGDPLAGVTVTCQVWEDGAWVNWDAESSGQLNPIVTDETGRYSWMVPEGLYRIRASKAGYADYDSLKDEKYAQGGQSTIIIPPPRTDVDIVMKAVPMAVYAAASAEGTLHLSAERASCGEMVTVTTQANAGYTASGVSVQTTGGETVAVTWNGTAASFRMPAADVMVYGQYVSAALPSLAIDAAGQGTVKVTVANLREDAELMVAFYEGSRMLGVTAYDLSGEQNKTVEVPIGSATEIRAFLLQRGTQAAISAKAVWNSAR